jgi:ankyrin repeat protein
MSVLPERPSLEHLRKQAKARRRERGIALSQAQHELAREYGFASWPKLVHAIQAGQLHGIERALVLADQPALAAVLEADPASATAEITDLPPLLVLLRRSIGTADIRDCTKLLLDAGADPDSHTLEWGGEGRMSTLFAAVERRDPDLLRLLLDAGATSDEDAFYHACEQSDTALLDALHRPGFENLINHKLDFEDLTGLHWFLDHGVDVNAHRCLHHAISRGRGVPILTALIDAGADVNLPWDRWDVGRRPLALAARCGHLAAFELLASRGAIAVLDPVDAAVLAVAVSRSACRRPRRRRWATRTATVTGWILGQFALLGRTDVVRALLDSGLTVDTRGWSNFTPLEQAAMHGRTQTVQLLIDRGADLHDCAFDEDGPTPLDCAIWGIRNNRAEDGDYPGTVQALLAACAPTRHHPPTGDPAVDKLFTNGHP